MRKLTIHRVRALGAFGLPYLIFSGNREEFISLTKNLPREELKELNSAFSLSNGETRSFGLGENQEAHFFAVILTDNRTVVSNQIIVDPGTEDVSFEILTDIGTHRPLTIQIVPVEQT